METRLEKHIVCRDCRSVGITYSDCRCLYDRSYPTIELEFTVCVCCDNIIDDGNPPDTEFNIKQYQNHKS